MRPHIVPVTIKKDRYFMCRPVIDTPPVVPFLSTSTGYSIAEPLIETIAAIAAVAKYSPGRKWG